MRYATRKGGVPDVEFEVGKWSADSNGGTQNGIEGRTSNARSADGDCRVHIQRSRPSMMSSTERRER
jgi:hypothetical protein